MSSRTRAQLNVLIAATAAGLFVITSAGAIGQQTAPPPTVPPPAGQQTPPPGGQGARQGGAGPNFEAALERQKQTDATWRAGSEGAMKMTKTTYKSRKDGLEIPVFVFEPLKLRGPKGHPAIVWVHPDIRGHVYEYYIPYTARGRLARLRRRRPRIPRERRIWPAVLRRDRLRRRRSRQRTDRGRLHQEHDAACRSRAHRDHRLESRRHDHAAVDHA